MENSYEGLLRLNFYLRTWIDKCFFQNTESTIGKKFQTKKDFTQGKRRNHYNNQTVYSFK